VEFHSFLQPKPKIAKAWAIEEEILGGAPLQASQKPLVFKTCRFFLETTLNTKLKVIAVCIGKTMFNVLEEHQNKSFPDRDYRPSDFDVKKNNFIQFLITDTLKTNNIKIPYDLLTANEAVIVYACSCKNYYFPVKTIVHQQLKLP